MHSDLAVSGLDTSLVFGDQSVTENILILIATVSDVVLAELTRLEESSRRFLPSSALARLVSVS